MRIDVDNLKGFPVGWGMAAAAKPCDSCKSSAALLFCRADSAFLCVGCDSKIHGANKLASRHERVWLCEVCEQAPAAVTCKADAAALCVNCDADIHSANPLARRHDRVPVEPFYDSAESIVKSSSSSSSAAASAANNTAIAAVNFLVPTKIDEDDDDGHDLNCLRHEEAEVASWILPNPPSNPKLATGEMFYSDFDHLLEFDYTNSIDLNFKQQQQQQQQQHSNHGSDSVVPVQLNKTPSSAAQAHHHSLVETCFDIDFCKSKLTAFNYTTAPSLSHSFSSSSLDVGVVPDGSVMSDISFGKKINNNTNTIGVDVGGGVTLLPTQPSIGLDREARVLRYREKRKNRKFEKTIRYASRKAYAETRPRIKGRFAKRTDNEIENENEVNHMFNMNSNDDQHHNFMVDNGYGVVPILLNN